MSNARLANVKLIGANEQKEFNAIGYVNVVWNGAQIASAPISDNNKHKLNQQFGELVAHLNPGDEYELYSSDEVTIFLRVPNDKPVVVRDALKFDASKLRKPE